jgi:uncharacterized membrane protein YfcA
MREAHVTLPERAVITGMRGMLGAGLGLLLADHLPDTQRKAIGWTLLLVSAATTLPLALDVLGSNRSMSRSS